MKISSSQGFSLVETLIALGVLTTGVLGVAAVLTKGMQHLSSSPSDVVVTQKAAQAVEAVFAARDSGKLTWAQIQNYNKGGVFQNGPQPLKEAGDDGVVNTQDESGEPVETTVYPGRDRVLGTADDVKVQLTNYTREIAIEDVANTSGELRKITVTITFMTGPTKKTYVLRSFISAFS
jgi:type II secretory pathway pseudopilin PulG